MQPKYIQIILMTSATTCRQSNSSHVHCVFLSTSNCNTDTEHYSPINSSTIKEHNATNNLSKYCM